jgi:prephenate dehydratase
MTLRIAYLGPRGTYTEEAALLYNGEAQLIPFPNVPAVAGAVDKGMADEGVVAIENSIEGSVTDTLDLLIHDSNLRIKRELVLPIEHYLLVKPGTQASEVQMVTAHPQALAQCRRFLERYFPKADLVAALSNASAVQEVMQSESPAAAIGPRRGVELYGAEVLAQTIQDVSSNKTRFVVLAHEDHAPTGRDKTSICFSFADDQPGLLVRALEEFAGRGINLAKIESRPEKTELGKYYFLVDLERHREEPEAAAALDAVKSQSAFFKIFGSYPRY